MEFKVLEAKAKQRGIEEIEIYEVKTNGLEMTCFDGEIEQNTTSMTHVFCIRGVYNHQLATVYTEKMMKKAWILFWIRSSAMPR